MAELDILFLNLHRRYLNTNANYGGFLGIYILAAFVKQEGYNAKSFAGNFEEGLKILDDFCTAGKISMVGLYCDYENVTENIFISRHVKEKYNLPVIIGGPQATALDENFFIASKCDAVVRYEGELTVLELMNFFIEEVGALENILGIMYLKGDKLQKNPERPLIQNLDALPFIDAECYIKPQDFYEGLSLMTGRGCPFHCAFCHEGAHTRAVRFRSVENVLAEIDAYLKVWNGGELYILFTDDTFTLNGERVKKICEGLIERRKHYDFKFFCEGHVHTLYKNPKMIKNLAAAGCVRIQLGIEAGTKKILSAYGKNTTPEEIFEVVKICRDSGIQQIYGNIILGGANFTREVFEADKKFALEILEFGCGTVELGVVTFWPLAETKMTRCPENFGMNILDGEFVTSAGGDFPQIETATLDKFTIAEMELELQQEILLKMKTMLESWQIPAERILSWFPKSSRSTNGLWFMELRRNEILFAYYEILKRGEGFHSSQIENLENAHPMRVAILYKYLQRIDDNTITICGENFFGAEIEIVLLTAGKLRVAEIAQRVKIEIPAVIKTLNKLEQKHFIVYTRS